MAKVLVVDDIADNVKLLEYDLEDDGYEVVTARNGEEALRVAGEEKPDVILLDIMMPVLDGIEACKRLKQDEELARIPVIMLSARDQDADVIRGLDVGALDYIAKPIHYPIVAARVRSAVRVKEHEDSMREMNEELRVARDLAEAGMRARSSFLATMSHEIRTPITAIMGLSEILVGDDELAPFDNAQAGQMIYGNSQYLLEIINNILDFSKAESGKFKVEQIQCSIFELLRNVSSVIELKAIEKDILFLVDFEYPLPKTFHSDPTRLTQALINLCANAVKFTESGSVQVEVRCDPDQERLEIKVTDSGIGMSGAEVERLFQPFQQANASITRRYGGTGLGLSITKEIVERLGGEIEVQSVQGEGSTFCLSIPTGAVDESEFVSEDPLLNAEEQSVDAQQFQGSVLLIEDDESNQQLIRYILERAGLQVETANDGEAGVSRALTGEFDLVLMDMRMPKLDGIVAARTLREENLEAPVVALTASQSHEEIEEFLQAGCEEYLPKPFQKVQLYDCLRRYLVSDFSECSAAVEQAIAESALPNDEKYAKLVVEYAAKLDGRLADLVEAFENRNWEALREQAHRLAGAGLFGFRQIALVAKRLEGEALRQDHEVCEELLKRLKDEVRKVTPGHQKRQEVSISSRGN